MSKPNGIPDDDRDRDEVARSVRSVKKADPELTVVEKMRLIVRDRQANRVNGLLVDLFTASVITQVYDAANDENKKKLDAMPIRKLALVCYRVANIVREKC
ncbi:MAG TPA: hypothetical protein VIE65_12405 [Methylobacter sp.]|jgi:hypothetical protein